MKYSRRSRPPHPKIIPRNKLLAWSKSWGYFIERCAWLGPSKCFWESVAETMGKEVTREHLGERESFDLDSWVEARLREIRADMASAG